jgi:hypothetical protein
VRTCAVWPQEHLSSFGNPLTSRSVHQIRRCTGVRVARLLGRNPVHSRSALRNELGPTAEGEHKTAQNTASGEKKRQEVKQAVKDGRWRE